MPSPRRFERPPEAPSASTTAVHAVHVTQSLKNLRPSRAFAPSPLLDVDDLELSVRIAADDLASSWPPRSRPTPKLRTVEPLCHGTPAEIPPRASPGSAAPVRTSTLPGPRLRESGPSSPAALRPGSPTLASKSPDLESIAISRPGAPSRASAKASCCPSR